MTYSEIERQKVLNELNLLDTNSEQMFDDITELASKICKTPVALLTILDVHKQLFKSRFGTNIKETPIEQAFCKLAIEKPNEIFIVEDATIDDRFKKNPLVCEDPKFISYYGIPIQSPKGIALGTLCVIDYKVNRLSKEQKEMLVVLSKHIEYLIELRSKTKLINTYQEKIIEYSKDFEDFAYLAAHDLKAPIRAIDSFVKILDKKYEAKWDEKDRKYFDFILQSTVKMNNLITNLLEYSKCTNNLTDFEEIDVKSIIDEVFITLTSNLDEKPNLITNTVPIIYTSKIGFTVLINNLLTNAIKFKKENAPQKIWVTIAEEGDFYNISITDNGIGIDETYFKYIFNPFKRLYPNSQYEGSGLGLTICKKIVENLKGSISVASVLGEGATFTVKLPK